MAKQIQYGVDALYVDRLKIVIIFMGDDVALSRDVDCFHRAGTNVAMCICYKLKKKSMLCNEVNLDDPDDRFGQNCPWGKVTVLSGRML